jgi:hypothetical protein
VARNGPGARSGAAGKAADKRQRGGRRHRRAERHEARLSDSPFAVLRNLKLTPRGTDKGK